MWLSNTLAPWCSFAILWETSWGVSLWVRANADIPTFTWMETNYELLENQLRTTSSWQALRSGKNMRFWGSKSLNWSCLSCVTLGKSPDLSESQLSYLNIGKINTYVSGSMGGLNGIAYKTCQSHSRGLTSISSPLLLDSSWTVDVFNISNSHSILANNLCWKMHCFLII